MSDQPDARNVPPTGADAGGHVSAEPSNVAPGEVYRHLFEAHPVPMAIWDPATGRILVANDAAVFQYGYGHDELIGLPIQRLVHPEDVPRLLDRLQQLPAGYAGTEVFRHVRKDGSVIEVEVSGHQLQFEGRTARLVLASDVTDRRRLEEQLRQSQKMEAVGRLAGGLAHDFNNLLMAIMGYSELLLERLPEGDDRAAVEEIRRAGERATAMTAQLLAFSRPHSLRPEAIDLNQLVASLGRPLERLVGPSIEVRIVPAADRPFIHADRAQVEEIVVSCAVNARDAMSHGGVLSIETSDVPADSPDSPGAGPSGEQHVLLSVSDTGVGMDPATLDRAFDPFFTTKPPGGTTGLGLAMVYAAVGRAGGQIRLESEPGRGSTVRILLPRIAPPGPATHAAALPSAATPTGAATILVAEDEPAVRTLVEQVLAKAGYAVIGAADGQSAIDAAARHDGHIDLLLTDIVMPGLTGTETARRLRTTRPGIRVLFMSGWAADALQREGIDEAAMDLLAKPFSVRDLIARVEQALGEQPDAG